MLFPKAKQTRKAELFPAMGEAIENAELVGSKAFQYWRSHLQKYAASIGKQYQLKAVAAELRYKFQYQIFSV